MLPATSDDGAEVDVLRLVVGVGEVGLPGQPRVVQHHGDDQDPEPFLVMLDRSMHPYPPVDTEGN